MNHRVCNARYPVIRPLRGPHNFLYNDRGPILLPSRGSATGFKRHSRANALHLRGGPQHRRCRRRWRSRTSDRWDGSRRRSSTDRRTPSLQDFWGIQNCVKDAVFFKTFSCAIMVGYRPWHVGNSAETCQSFVALLKDQWDMSAFGMGRGGRN